MLHYDTSHIDYTKAKLENDLSHKISDDTELKNGKYDWNNIIIYHIYSTVFMYFEN